MSILDKVKANPIGTANTVYLIFPILSLTLLGYKGPLWGGIFVTILFILSYLIMIYEDLTEKVKLRRVLLLIHFLGIIYFVAFFHAFDIMFFFYGAFIIPYAFQVKLNSIEVLMYFIAFSLSLTIVVLDYKDYLFVLSPMSIVFILLLLGNFKAIEADKLKEEINSKNEHINILIAEQERNRIGQDLHDTLGHVFASLSIKSELAMKLADNDIEQAKEEMASVNELSKEALVKVRAIVDDLKLQSFEEEVETMDTLLKNANLSFEFNHAIRASILSPTKQSALSMVLREAINNVIKHAQATKVTGTIIENDQNIIMVIEDDGKGMKKINDNDFNSIKQRINVFNGDLEVNNIDDGFKMTISLPKGG